jgi:chondroitin 4-sulfotransferase 11
MNLFKKYCLSPFGVKTKDCIFIHIQKTAGKSIRQALGLKKSAKHKFAQQRRDECSVDEWNNTFKFTFVRNPWDRLISCYMYRTQGGNGTVEDRERARLYPDNFTEFCDNIDAFISLPNESMFIPQYRWISDEKDNLLVDFVGKVENIEADFQHVCNELGIKRHVKLPHINKSVHGDYREYYNKNTQLIIAKVYEKDIERFGYTF